MKTEKIFSYGTLQYEPVQLSTFGRLLNGKKDTLTGYQLSELKITDPHVIAVSGESIHRILLNTENNDDQVEGMVFDLTTEELIQADKYEVSDYKRVSVTLSSGINAWVYVRA